MITKETTLPLKTEYLSSARLILNALGNPPFAPEYLLYFDIETTGLSPDTSYLYLIGCMFIKDDNVRLIQYFSEGIEEEALLLEAFNSHLKQAGVLVHFNGQTFDIPYVTKKMTTLGLKWSNSDILSFDIYRQLKPLKKLFGLSSMSQKSMESFAGIYREDMYDGGQLIEVYNRYLAVSRLEKLRGKCSNSASVPASGSVTPHVSPDTGLMSIQGCSSGPMLELLLLHNFEDVENMIHVASLCAVTEFFEGDFSVTKVKKTSCEEASITVLLHSEYEIVYKVLSKGMTLNNDSGITCAYLIATSDSVRMDIPVFRGELKLFYPDYRDYRYLPAEDTAMHKSIADFLDKGLYVKCTAANCYERFTGEFVPVRMTASELRKLPEENLQVFTQGHRDKYGYLTVDYALKNPRILIETIILSPVRDKSSEVQARQD